MTPLAGDWWASGSLWQFVITIVSSVAVGALGAWATLRSSNPKRKVLWWVQSKTPLIRPNADRTVAVTFRNLPLSNPHIVELAVSNQGRRDITAAMFHADAPMRFDLGAKVCELLEVTTQPSGSVRPPLEAGPHRVVAPGTAGRRVEFSTWVELKPSLLSRGQVVTVTILVDGNPRQVSCVSAPLVDVSVREGGERSPLAVQAQVNRAVLRNTVAMAWLFLGILVSIWLAGR